MTNIKTRIQAYFRSRCKDRYEELQLVVFLTASAMIIFGMPLHFGLGLIGYKGIYLKVFSLATWVSSVVIVSLYLTRLMSLRKSFFWLAVSFQTLESMGIVFLAVMARPEWLEAHQMFVLLNEIQSLSTLLLVSMGLVPKAPTVVFALFSVSIGASYIICPEVMLPDFVLLFFFAMSGIWGYSFVMQHLIKPSSREIGVYKQFQDSVLDMFDMSKDEFMALIHLCQNMRGESEKDKSVLSHLTEHTRHNLIALGTYLRNERRDQAVDLSTVFPQLSPTEQEVARLILKDLSLKEIAIAMDKNLSNVGTVRCNIRKKLGLTPDDDLREYLLKTVEGKWGGNTTLQREL